MELMVKLPFLIYWILCNEYQIIFQLEYGLEALTVQIEYIKNFADTATVSYGVKSRSFN